MKEEHPLIADILKNMKDNDRTPHHRRITHSCGHKSNDTIWGDYRMEDRFNFKSEHKCPVCMMYDSAIHCFGFSHKNFGKNRKTGFCTLKAMINTIELDDISA